MPVIGIGRFVVATAARSITSSVAVTATFGGEENHRFSQGCYTVMSSPTHPTPSDIDEECAFPFANILDYTSTLPNYFPATSRNNSSENSKNDEIPPVFSPFYNNPYLNDMQAFYAKGSPIPPPDPITPPTILTPSQVLPPSLLFDP
ncbi:hypothetical protein Tco_0829628 [Tanacetum coccineum]